MFNVCIILLSSLVGQLLALEHEKLQLLEFIGEQGLRLPKTLRSALQRTPLYRSTTGTGSSSTTGNSNSGNVRSTAVDVLHGRSPHTREQQRGLYGDGGYAEEVDVDCADVTTSTVYTNATTTGGSTLDMPKKSPTQPKIQDRKPVSNSKCIIIYVLYNYSYITIVRTITTTTTTTTTTTNITTITTTTTTPTLFHRFESE